MKSHPLPRPAVYALLTIVLLCWSGNNIVGRAIRHDIPPFSLAFFRWTGAAALILPFAWRGLIADWPVIRREWPRIVLLGAVGVGSFNAFLYSGLRYTTATNAGLITALPPTLVLIFNFAFFRVRPSIAQIAGVTVAAIGVGVIVFRADPAALAAMRFGFGDALVLCGAVVWSAYTVLLRLAPRIRPLSFLALTFLLASAMMSVPAAFEWGRLPLHFTWQALGGIAYVAIFPSIVAYSLFNMAVREIGGPATSQVTSLQPISGALLAVTLLGESLHGYHFAGMALILIGIGIPLVMRD